MNTPPSPTINACTHATYWNPDQQGQNNKQQDQPEDSDPKHAKHPLPQAALHLGQQVVHQPTGPLHPAGLNSASLENKHNTYSAAVHTALHSLLNPGYDSGQPRPTQRH